MINNCWIELSSAEDIYQFVSLCDCDKLNHFGLYEPQFSWSLKYLDIGMPGWLSGWVSAFGPGRDPGIQDRVPYRAPCMEPASPSACVSASLWVSRE